MATAFNTSTAVVQTLVGPGWYPVFDKSNYLYIDNFDQMRQSTNTNFYWRYLPSGFSADAFVVDDYGVYMWKSTPALTSIRVGGLIKNFANLPKLFKLLEDGYLSNSTPWLITLPDGFADVRSASLRGYIERFDGYYYLNNNIINFNTNYTSLTVDGHNVEVSFKDSPLVLVMSPRLNVGAGTITAANVSPTYIDKRLLLGGSVGGSETVLLKIESSEGSLSVNYINPAASDSDLSEFAERISKLNNSQNKQLYRVATSPIGNDSSEDSALKNPLVKMVGMSVSTTSFVGANTRGTSSVAFTSMSPFEDTVDNITLKSIRDVTTGELLDISNMTLSFAAVSGKSTTHPGGFITITYPDDVFNHSAHSRNIEGVYLAEFEFKPYGEYAGATASCYVFMGYTTDD